MATSLKQFKIGDKVRILPSAIDIGVATCEVGKVGTLVDNTLFDKYLYIQMDMPRGVTDKIWHWAVKPTHVALIIKVGQQLEFAFMRTSS